MMIETLRKVFGIAFLEDSESDWFITKFLIKQNAPTIYGASEAISNLSLEATKVLTSSGDTSAFAYSEAEGLKVVTAIMTCTTEASTTGDALLVLGGSIDIICTAINALHANAYFGSNELYFEGIVDTYCHGINIKEELFEVAQATAMTSLTGNYYTYQTLEISAEASTYIEYIKRMSCSMDASTITYTDLVYATVYYVNLSTNGNANTTCLPYLFIAAHDLALDGSATTTLLARIKGFVNELFLNRSGFYTTKYSQGRQLFLKNNKIVIGEDVSNKPIMFRLNKLLLSGGV